LKENQPLLPAWSLLDRTALIRLLRQSEAISIVEDADPEAIRKVPLVVMIHALIERAVTSDGLMLTATGNLSRADVALLFEKLDWPDYDKDMVLAVNKVLNEIDVMPIHIARIVAQEGKLLRKRKARMYATKLAKEMISPGREPALFQTIFETLFWRINTGYFDRSSIEDWPQDHVGVVLWCLSVSAHDWMPPSELTGICTLPYQGETLRAWDLPEYAVEARILRPLTWLGLMEQRRSVPDDAFSRHEYRKSPLFDSVLKFDVNVAAGAGPAH
jgi:hypothetical protein